MLDVNHEGAKLVDMASSPTRGTVLENGNATIIGEGHCAIVQ